MSEETKAPPHNCTECLARDKRTPAVYVCRDASGLQWFDCGEHPATRQLGVMRTPIDEWFRAHGLLEPLT
jgi:hypothetical protein